jgi:hypothetical protein
LIDGIASIDSGKKSVSTVKRNVSSFGGELGGEFAGLQAPTSISTYVRE